MRKAQHGSEPEFEIISAIPMWKALLAPPTPKPGSFALRTIFPLRIEKHSGSDTESEEQETSPIMGVLEFYRDITEDFKALIAIQRLIMGTVIFSVVALFALFRFCSVRRVKDL